MSSSTEDASKEQPPPASRPIVWIIATAVCGLAAIGFLIWALTANSNKNDAQDQVAALKLENANLRATGAATLKAALARYTQAVAALRITARGLAQSESDLKNLRAEYQAATQAAKAATTNLQKQLDAANARAALLQKCLGTTVAIFRRPYTGLGVFTALDRAATNLDRLGVYCAP